MIVIGAGPAGFMAAGRAAIEGAQVILLEKMTRPGIKLSMTGNGRGNLTHIGMPEDFLPAFGKNGRFLRQAFARFFNEDLISFFQELGVDTVPEKDGKIYTRSGSAAQAVEALMKWVKENKVDLRVQSPVMSLIIENDAISGIKLKDGTSLEADTVLIATGGATYPGTGSTGDGFRLAESAGHSVSLSRAALVPIETEGHLAQGLQGISMADIVVRIFTSNKKVAEQRGDILFTHFGLSGPAVLSVSGEVSDQFAEGNGPLSISLDLLPDKSAAAVNDDLLNRLDLHGRMLVRTLLSERMPEKLAAAILKSAEIKNDMPGHQLPKKDRIALASLLKDWRFVIRTTRPMTEAMVTRGGVDLNEVNPRTMESQLIKGLYFAGEVLDIDGDTGGYNLQAAFSTGYVAGTSMA